MKRGTLGKITAALAVVLWLFASGPFCARAQEDSSGQLADYDFSQIESFLEGQEGMEGWNLSFSQLMELLIAGKGKEAADLAVNAVKTSLFSEIRGNSRILIQIIALGLAGAVFTNFSGVFSANQVSETGFFITYLLIFSCLGVSFFASVTLAGETMGKILEFIRLLMPSYFMAVAFSGGSASSLALYETMFFTVSIVEWLFARILLPLIKIYLLFSLAGHIAKEDMLSRLTDLIGSIVNWGMKTVIGLVLGLNLLQGMIMPYVDAVKNSTMEKAIEAIPGIGKGAGIAAQLMLGSGILIKNTMGAAAAAILLILAAIPVVKLGVLAFMYQCTAAALEPVCDKRITACVGAAAEGHKLLVKMLAYSVVLFIIVIAMACSATNAVYFGG